MKHGYEDDDEFEYREPKQKTKKKKKKKSKLKRVIIVFLIILFMLISMALGVIVGYGYNMIGQMNQDVSFDKSQIEINEGVETTGYINLYLFGVDARSQKNSYEGSLSDVIMVVSINQDTKKVKIASVYRDTYLQNTKTKSFDKITHTFGSGGPSLSMSTLNTNLDLDITEYVAINFNVVVDVVDAVGGVTIDLTSEEAYHINAYIDEINKDTGHKSKRITKAGTYTLDGVQACAYARIRYTSGGDWKRTERQREVLQKVFEKAKTMKLTDLNNLATKVLKQVSTNVDTKEILYLASQAGNYQIEETKGWPFEVADYQPAGVWYGVPKNLEKQVVGLHEYLFEDEEYQVSETVKAISDKMIRQTGIK